MHFIKTDFGLTAIAGLALLLTDRVLSPLLAVSEWGFLLKMFVQAWIFLYVVDQARGSIFYNNPHPVALSS